MKKSDQKRKILTKTPDVYPMRINKYLAHKGLATRTGVDDLIKAGKILINDKIAKLGDKVLETDKIVVRGTHNKKKYIYLAYNKPKGVVSTNPQSDEKDIMQSVNISENLTNLPLDKGQTEVFPVGRLDKESSGLIILTNDGRITDRLLNPVYDHEKEYVVEVDRKFTPGFLRNMQDGVDIGEAITKPCKVAKINDTSFKIILTEGRNRQIRRMTEKLGYTVRDLQRIRIQNVELNPGAGSLGKIALNSYREIKGESLSQFLKSIGLSQD